MHPIINPFPSGTTRRIRIRPARPHSLVVLDRTGCKMLDHPVADVRYSTLMVMTGTGDLVRTKPKYLAERLLTLPGVLPDEHRDGEYADVPLSRPDRMESDSYTTWTIVPRRLLVDQIDHARAEFSFPGPDSPDVRTIELLPEQWWHLVRVLVSLDHWMTFLRGALDTFAQDVRRVVEPGTPLLTVSRIRGTMWRP